MNEQQNKYLETYCGMWEARAQVLADIEDGKKVNGASYKHFMDAGAIAEDGRLNTWGMVLLVRVISIIQGTFIPEEPFLPREVLHEIDATRVARWTWVKEGHYLRSVDLKILRSMAITPGAVYCSYVPGYGHAQIRSLITRGYAKSEGHQPTEGWNAMDYCRMFLTQKGENLVRDIVKSAVKA